MSVLFCQHEIGLPAPLWVLAGLFIDFIWKFRPMALSSTQPYSILRTQKQKRLALVSLLAIGLVGCAKEQIPTREVTFYQSWQLQPGKSIGEVDVVSSLGDVSLALKGKSVYAPFQGTLSRQNDRCLIFSSPELPAYLFRLCGLRLAWFPPLGKGELQEGDLIGTANILEFATLRKQPNGTWAFVEPSSDVVNRLLKQP